MLASCCICLRLRLEVPWLKVPCMRTGPNRRTGPKCVGGVWLAVPTPQNVWFLIHALLMTQTLFNDRLASCLAGGGPSCVLEVECHRKPSRKNPGKMCTPSFRSCARSGRTGGGVSPKTQPQKSRQNVYALISLLCAVWASACGQVDLRGMRWLEGDPGVVWRRPPVLPRRLVACYWGWRSDHPNRGFLSGGRALWLLPWSLDRCLRQPRSSETWPCSDLPQSLHLHSPPD